MPKKGGLQRDSAARVAGLTNLGRLGKSDCRVSLRRGGDFERQPFSISISVTQRLPSLRAKNSTAIARTTLAPLVYAGRNIKSIYLESISTLTTPAQESRLFKMSLAQLEEEKKQYQEQVCMRQTRPLFVSVSLSAHPDTIHSWTSSSSPLTMSPRTPSCSPSRPSWTR